MSKLCTKNTSHSNRWRQLHFAVFVLAQYVWIFSTPCASFSLLSIQTKRPSWSTTTLHQAALKEPENSQFGRQDYWNRLYEDQSNFSWYAGWDDLQPFVEEFLGPPCPTGSPQPHILIPGVGNDAMLVDMFSSGYTNLTAMDYAPEGIARCREMFSSSQLRDNIQNHGVSLVVADARDLEGVFAPNSFEAVLEKGTLDAIFLSGGQDKDAALQILNLAISELSQRVAPGGIWISIAAVVDDLIETAFDERDEWTCLVRKDDLYMTQDGFTSNNIHGSLLVWQKAK